MHTFRVWAPNASSVDLVLRDGVLPLREGGEAEILKDQHRVSGCQLAQERAQVADRHGEPPAAPRGGEDIGLEGALAARRKDLRGHLILRHRKAGPGQHHGQRGGTAIILFLGEEGHGRQLGPRRQIARAPPQVEDLRRSGATGKKADRQTEGRRRTGAAK